MPAGGARVGAGHPTNAAVREKKAAAARDTAAFTRSAIKNLAHNYDKLQELADGIWVEQTTSEGIRRVYKKPPDRMALMCLVDHGKGKAAQAPAVTQSMTVNLYHQVPRPDEVAPIPEAADAEAVEV